MIRILIVEDDEIIANEVAKSLNSWGFDAVIARAFDRIDEEFAASNAQLVIMDISLPYYNGYYWCERIRRHSKAPIVFLSSRADTAGRGHGGQHGRGRLHHKACRDGAADCKGAGDAPARI